MTQCVQGQITTKKSLLFQDFAFHRTVLPPFCHLRTTTTRQSLHNPEKMIASVLLFVSARLRRLLNYKEEQTQCPREWSEPSTYLGADVHQCPSWFWTSTSNHPYCSSAGVFLGHAVYRIFYLVLRGNFRSLGCIDNMNNYGYMDMHGLIYIHIFPDNSALTAELWQLRSSDNSEDLHSGTPH